MAKIDVAPLAGARIEIGKNASTFSYGLVAPLAGARIEIFVDVTEYTQVGSLPSRERGLKYLFSVLFSLLTCVAPLAGARIEIVCNYPPDNRSYGSRSPRGSAD